MEEYLLLTLWVKTTKSILIYGFGIYKKVVTDMELLKVYPHYISLKIIMNYLFFPLKIALRNLNNNISFLDILEDKKNISFILGCVWCSLCNGIIETAKQNIIKNDQLVNQIDFEKLKYLNMFLDFILVNRTEKLTNNKKKILCLNTFGKTTIKLLLFTQIYLKLEMIELRWCPFKRSKKFYYRNKDKRYLQPTKETIYKVGEILSKYETINCNNCPCIVNKNWQYKKGNKQSVFQPLLDYMINEINKS